MTEDKGPLDQALDLFVFAPLGFALAAREELPRLAERAHRTVDPQLTMARMIGEFAVNQGGKEAEKALRRLGETLNDLFGGGAPSPVPTPAPARASAPAAPRSPQPQAQAQAAKAATNGSGPSADDLAIPGYDALAASQVVQRLAGLSIAELEAVRAYEEATRHRKTILNRVAQLQAESAGSAE